jgi:hypothetical protein
MNCQDHRYANPLQFSGRWFSEQGGVGLRLP